MAGTSSKSQKFEMRVPIAALTAWKADAVAGNISVAMLILRRMEAGPPVMKAKLDELEADIERLTISLARVTELEAEVRSLNGHLAVRQERISQLEEQLAAAETRISPTKALAVFRDPSMKAIDPNVHHQSGPVFKSAVPTAVQGQAKPFFKPNQRAALDVVGQKAKP